MLIGIIGAMHEEIIELKSDMKNIEEITVTNLTFFKGNLKGKEVVLVEGGIGKVNASVCTTLLISHFKVNKIIFTGVAGGVNKDIKVGDIVLSTDLMEHDFDCTAFGDKPGVIPRMEVSEFKSDAKLLELAKAAAEKVFDKDKIWVGRIVSGDQFIASTEKVTWLEETFNALCTEMEGAAVAHTCYLFDVPFVILRAISDNANHDADVDFAEFVKLAAKNSKLIVEGMLETL